MHDFSLPSAVPMDGHVHSYGLKCDMVQYEMQYVYRVIYDWTVLYLRSFQLGNVMQIQSSVALFNSFLNICDQFQEKQRYITMIVDSSVYDNFISAINHEHWNYCTKYITYKTHTR